MHSQDRRPSPLTSSYPMVDSDNRVNYKKTNQFFLLEKNKSNKTTDYIVSQLILLCIKQECMWKKKQNTELG